jgi:hypothetical protein
MFTTKCAQQMEVINMKKFTTILCSIVLIFGYTDVFPQNIVDIPLDEFDESFALKEIIDGDSLNPADAYRLARGGWYYVTGLIEHTFPLTIIGADEPANLSPPVLLLATDAFGESSRHMLRSMGDLTLKNLYIAGTDDLENFKAFCIVDANNVRIVVEDCYLTYNGHHNGLFLFNPGISGYDFFFKRNFVFNLQRPDGYHWSRLMYGKEDVCYGDSMVIQHNTMWGIAGELYGIRSEPNYFLVDHNTFVAEGQVSTLGQTWRYAQFSNNIYHNVQAHGDAPNPVRGYRRAQNNGQLDQPLSNFIIDTLSTEYPGEALDSVLNAAGIPYQTVTIHHNNFYQDPKLVTYLDGLPDTVALVPLMINQRALDMCANDAEFPGLEWDAATNTQVDPGFTHDPTDIDSLIAWANYQLMDGPNANFMWIPNSETLLDFVWPLPKDVFDFTYSNAALVASDGYHMGDLYHWYPEEYDALITSVEENTPTATTFTLAQKYPNPFNPET